MDQQIEAVHDFWFGPLDEAGMCAPQQHDLWFQSSAEIDADIRQRFAEVTARATAGELQAWEQQDFHQLQASELLLPPQMLPTRSN